MSRERLLDIKPRKLKFRFELNQDAFCTIKLSNNSRHHVAFKVMTTNREKYFVRPTAGVVLPRSSCDVRVRMLAPKEVPSDKDSRDKFLIKSVVSSPVITTEDARKLFHEGRRDVDAHILGVVYDYPPSGAGLSTSNDSQSLVCSPVKLKLNGTAAHIDGMD